MEAPAGRRGFRCRVHEGPFDPDVEQRWSSHVASALVTALAGLLLTYLVLRTQRLLPGNLDYVGDLSPGCRSTPRSAS